MSRVAELDHRIGRHDERPDPNCPLCNPDVPFAPTSTVAETGPKWWDSYGLEPPAYPDWGTVWRRVHKDGAETAYAFVNPGGKEPGGFWVPLSLRYEESLKTTDSFWIFDRAAPAIQTELGSGKWSKKTRMMEAAQTLPSEAALSSPLGVDLPQMAKEQNRAKLIVGMREEHWFPVSEVEDRISEEAATNLTKVQSRVYTVSLPPE